ncbi:MAG TPA: nitronate monooxygenase, partial [Byssovorax sp.]
MSAASPWPDPRALALLGVELPIVQSPMAGFAFGELAIAVAKAGGLGSLACASLSPERLRTEWGSIRKATTRPINLNFFCHAPPPREPEREAAWQARLSPYFAELGLDASVPRTAPGRAPFDEATCDLVCELAPEIVSFHFGLPDEALVARLRKASIKLLSSATTVAEARWLEDHGCDAIIAQGFEAGGHRASFLSIDRAAVHGEARARVPSVATQVGTFALVPQVVDAVRLPVI